MLQGDKMSWRYHNSSLSFHFQSSRRRDLVSEQINGHSWLSLSHSGYLSLKWNSTDIFNNTNLLFSICTLSVYLSLWNAPNSWEFTVGAGVLTRSTGRFGHVEVKLRIWLCVCLVLVIISVSFRHTVPTWLCIIDLCGFINSPWSLRGPSVHCF